MSATQELFVGLAHARPTEQNADEEVRGAVGAYVQVVALADDAGAFTQRVALALEDIDYELLSVEAVRPFSDALRDELLGPSLLELANNAAYENDTRFGTFHLYEEEDREGTDDASIHHDEPLAVIDSALSHQALVELRRAPVPNEELEGFVVGRSGSWVLLHKTTDYIFLDGYAAFPADDVFDVWIVTDESRVTRRVLELRGEAAQPLPELELTSARRIIEEANRLYPLVTVFVEREIPDVAYIGRVSSFGDGTLVLDLITPGGVWNGEMTFSYESVTRIDFGGRYEEALALIGGDGQS